MTPNYIAPIESFSVNCSTTVTTVCMMYYGRGCRGGRGGRGGHCDGGNFCCA